MKKMAVSQSETVSACFSQPTRFKPTLQPESGRYVPGNVAPDLTAQNFLKKALALNAHMCEYFHMTNMYEWNRTTLFKILVVETVNNDGR
jgi:hypothetical protein